MDFKNGDLVQVRCRRTGKGDYTEEAVVARLTHDGESGAVSHKSNSHGECYEVTFRNGSQAWYDPEEMQHATVGQ